MVISCSLPIYPSKWKEKQVSLTLTDEFFDFDFIADRIPGPGQPPVKDHTGIQQTIGSFTSHGQVDTQVGAQKKIGLTGFNGYAHRRAIAVQIPGAGQHIVFGDQTTGCQATL